MAGSVRAEILSSSGQVLFTCVGAFVGEHEYEGRLDSGTIPPQMTRLASEIFAAAEENAISVV